MECAGTGPHNKSGWVVYAPLVPILVAARTTSEKGPSTWREVAWMLGLLEVLPSNDRRCPGVPPSRTEREKSSTIRLVRRVKPAVGVGDDALELPVCVRAVPCRAHTH